MSFIAVSAGLGAVSLGTSIYKGIKQSSEANAIKRNNPRPNYDIPPEYQQNLAMAQHMAQVGLPQAQYNNQFNAINRNQAGAVAALGNSANQGAGLAGIVRAGNDANNQLNAQDAIARRQNQGLVTQANSQLGQQKLAAQQYNKFDKYTENFNQAAALQGASNQNIQNGINGADGLAGNLYGLKQMGGLGFGGSGSGGGSQWGVSGDPYAAYSASRRSGGLGFGLTNQPQVQWGGYAPVTQNPYDPSQYGGATWGVN